jgi:hypothetical protein
VHCSKMEKVASVTSTEDNSNGVDTEQYVSDVSDTLDLSNVSQADNQGILLLRRLQQLKVSLLEGDML